MIIEDFNQHVERSKKFKELNYRIDEEGLPQILEILENKLYTDKIAAVIRETCANGLDAHVAAGKPTQPLEITLPNSLNPVYEIRDFGFGLTLKEVEEILCSYGKSTKRKSNDYIGAMGIGFKSPFCYVDSFIVTSYVNGIKTVYNSYKDEQRKSKIAIMHTEPCDEPAGLKISVSVKESDIYSFVNKARSIFHYFKVKPKISGVPDFEYHEDKVVFEGNGWKYHGSYKKSMAIMGNVAYSIDFDSFRDKIDPNQYLLLSGGVNIDFNIGDLQVSANREGLQYTEKTIDVLKNKVNVIMSEVKAMLQKRMDDCKNLFEAKRLYSEIVRNPFLKGRLDNDFNGTVVWQGEQIRDSYIKHSFPAGVFKTYSYKRSSRSYNRKVRGEDTSYLDCGSNYQIRINDTGRKSVVGRVATLLDADQTLEKVYVLDTKETNLKDEFEQKFLTKTDNLLGLKNISIHPDFIRNKSGIKKKIYHTYEIDLSKLDDCYSYKSFYVCLAPVDDKIIKDTKNKIIFQLDKKSPDLGKGYCSGYNQFTSIVKGFQDLGIKLPKIYGLTSAFFFENKDKHILFKDWSLKRVKRHKIGDDLACYLSSEDIHINYSLLTQLETQRFKLSSKSLMFRFLDKYFDVNSIKKAKEFKAYRAINHNLDIFSLEKENELQKMYEEMESRYPLFVYLMRNEDKDIIIPLLNYIKLIDEKP